MSNKLLSYIEDRLYVRRRHLLKEIDLRLSKSNRSRVCWATATDDIASKLAEHNIVMSMAQGEAQEINQIDNALEKMRNGEYGVCDCCGGNINKHRLIAIPFVTLCIKCKEAEERDEGIMVNGIGSSAYEGFDEVEKKISNVMDDGCSNINQSEY